MTPEEFLNEIRKSEEELKQAEKIAEAFVNELTALLVEHVYNWYPEWQPRRSDTEKQVARTAEEYAVEVLQLFGSIAYHCQKGDPGEEKNTVPQPRTREESEKDLQEILKMIPPENREYMEEMHWEDFEWQQHHEGFRFEAHRLMKKAFTDYYCDEIMNLEAGCFRQLDSFVYYLGAVQFVEKCYEMMD